MAGTITQARAVQIRVGGATIDGDLAVPETGRGLIIFAHGSGSSRHSSRNRFVAERLREAGHGTLLLDLLTAEEERADLASREYRFDIDLLAARVTTAVDWAQLETAVAALPIGLFGASTGAAAALMSAAERPALVKAVVSRGGRPDLAGDALRRVAAPTLLVVGGDDEPVIDLNMRAMAALRCEKQIEIVPGATHLFEEPGKLEEVARLAADWFTRHL